MPLDNSYRNYELRSNTLIPANFKSYLLSKDVEVCNAFHKISILGWPHSSNKLTDHCEFITNSYVILVKYGYDDKNNFFFHTNNIKLLQTLIDQGLSVNANRNIYDVEVTAFCATSLEMIGYEKMDDLIENISRKLLIDNETYDLSNIESEEEFTKRNILWSIQKTIQYKHIFERTLSQVTILKLSNNCLSQISRPLKNLFKSKLKSLDLSKNELQSLTKLYILKDLPLEELWLDENPLCEEYRSPIAYIKDVKAMFPRLLELDGITIGNNDFVVPLLRNYLVKPDAETLVEKFISFFFPTFDSGNRDILFHAYHISALLTISTCGINFQEDVHPVFTRHARNLSTSRPLDEAKKIVIGSSNILNVLKAFSDTEHDLSTFEIDVLSHVPNWQTMFSINGVYKEVTTSSDVLKNNTKYYFFRRCFILVPTGNYLYAILNDMLFVRPADVYETDKYIKRPASKLNELALTAPDEEDVMTIVDTFAKLSTLRPDIAKKRLKVQNWDIRKALLVFIDEYNNKLVPKTDFASDEEDFEN